MQTAYSKRFAFFLLPFVFSLLSGCASLQVAGEVQAGRLALIADKPDLALTHFERASELDPNYIQDYSPLRQAVWTYLGRAQYGTGKFPEARKSLERALSRDDQDYIAKLYLGLTLARDGDKGRGVKEIQSGLQGIHDWLDWITYYTTYGIYWDPRREIRNEIKTNLAMISGKEIDWQKLIASGEEIGKKMEQEIDLARRDEKEAYNQGEGKEP